jgi:hypothetical protein
MPNRRSRARRKFLRYRIPSMIAQYSLEIGMICWGLLLGVNVIVGNPPSSALRSLPDPMETAWALLMVLSSLVTLLGLWTRLRSTIASGMQAFGCILAAYAAAVMAVTPWARGGTVTGFLFIIGGVCLIRGWWLKEEEIALIKENARLSEAEETDGRS